MSEAVSVLYAHLNQLIALSEKRKKQGVLFLSFFPFPSVIELRTPKNRETALSIIGFCQLNDASKLADILRYVDGKISAVILDVDKKLPLISDVYYTAYNLLKSTKLHIYSDTSAWCAALSNLVVQLCVPSAPLGATLKRALLVGDGSLTYKLAQDLLEKSYDVVIDSSNNPDDSLLIINALNLTRHAYETAKVTAYNQIPSEESFDILVGTHVSGEMVMPHHVEKISSSGIVVDGGLGSISTDALKLAEKRNLSVYRLDSRAAITAIMQTVLETEDLIQNRMGRETIAGVPVVSGGIMGKTGDVIVDSIKNPSTIVGIADGVGRVRDRVVNSDELARILKIEELIRCRH